MCVTPVSELILLCLQASLQDTDSQARAMSAEIIALREELRREQARGTREFTRKFFLGREKRGD